MGGQDRIPGTAQGPLAQRLWSDMTTQLAERIGCCPIHGTRLICALHDVELTSSAAEKAEMEALMRLDVKPTFVTWPCARCHAANVALCLDCYEPVADQMFAGLTPAEEARLVELAKKTARFTFMPDPDVTGPGELSHEGGSIP
jgi:hypothetical protein